jgi:hypothetical protein
MYYDIICITIRLFYLLGSIRERAVEPLNTQKRWKLPTNMCRHKRIHRRHIIAIFFLWSLLAILFHHYNSGGLKREKIRKGDGMCPPVSQLLIKLWQLTLNWLINIKFLFSRRLDGRFQLHQERFELFRTIAATSWRELPACRVSNESQTCRRGSLQEPEIPVEYFFSLLTPLSSAAAAWLHHLRRRTNWYNLFSFYIIN